MRGYKGVEVLKPVRRGRRKPCHAWADVSCWGVASTMNPTSIPRMAASCPAISTVGHWLGRWALAGVVMALGLSPVRGQNVSTTKVSPSEASSAPSQAGAAALVDVSVALGRQQFQPGDLILIQEVRAASAKLTAGDQVVVRGHYRLQTRASAIIALYAVANASSEGVVHTQKSQTKVVEIGEGDFELGCEVGSDGQLCLSFHPPAGNGSFGGIFFTSTARANEVPVPIKVYYQNGPLQEISAIPGVRDFLAGDAIAVTDLWATSAAPGMGDRIMVHGRYRLKTQKMAVLAIYLTASGQSDQTLSAPLTRMVVLAGEDDFELSCGLPKEGKLRLTFEPYPAGPVFGGIYFSPGPKPVITIQGLDKLNAITAGAKVSK